MQCFLNIKIIALGLILLLGNMPVGATERPFSCTGKGIATIIPGAGVPAADVVGTGNGTHLGLFASAGRVTFNPDPDNPTLVHPSGQATFTAADGDKLETVFNAAETSMDLTTGIGGGIFHFTGGTGKFANATGSISVVVEQNFITGAYELTAVGKIDY
jgi:hypothetical protein